MFGTLEATTRLVAGDQCHDVHEYGRQVGHMLCTFCALFCTVLTVCFDGLTLQGDSGGPMVAVRNRHDTDEYEFVLVGVTSYVP